jgi:hypothetical protein
VVVLFAHNGKSIWRHVTGLDASTFHAFSNLFKLAIIISTIRTTTQSHALSCIRWCPSFQQYHFV